MVVSASKMVAVAQLARASACGAEGYRIIPGRPPQVEVQINFYGFFYSHLLEIASPTHGG